MSDTALVKRPVGDDLAVKLEAFRNEQLAEREKNEAPLKRRVLIESFLRLAERYFKASREFVKNLSKEERVEFLNQVFEEAKRCLRWQSPLIHSVALTVVGALFILGIYNNRKANFPAFKLRRLYKWYMENYGSDDLEKAMKSGDFDKKISAKTMSLALAGSLIKKPISKKTSLAPIAGDVQEACKRGAQSIDFDPAILLQTQLALFFNEKAVKLFDYGEVDGYLRYQANLEKKKWHWRPLREKDIIKEWGYPGNEKEGHGFYWSSRWECRTYAGAIPVRTMEIVEGIVRLLGDKVHFFVSEHAQKPQDRFIVVAALDMNMMIFDSWHDDELKQPSA